MKIRLVEVYKRVGKSVISVSYDPKELTEAFYGCEKSRENFLVLGFIHFLTVHWQQLEGIQSSKLQ